MPKSEKHISSKHQLTEIKKASSTLLEELAVYFILPYSRQTIFKGYSPKIT